MAKKLKTKLWAWQQKAQEGGKCEKCLKDVPYLTVDHIVPVTIIEQLDFTGNLKYELEENFQLLCYPCNRFKACRLDISNPKTKEILLKLLG